MTRADAAQWYARNYGHFLLRFRYSARGAATARCRYCGGWVQRKRDGSVTFLALNCPHAAPRSQPSGLNLEKTLRKKILTDGKD